MTADSRIPLIGFRVIGWSPPQAMKGTWDPPLRVTSDSVSTRSRMITAFLADFPAADMFDWSGMNGVKTHDWNLTRSSQSNSDGDTTSNGFISPIADASM